MSANIGRLCGFCGAQVVSGEAFCPHCGKNIEWGSAGTTSAPPLAAPPAYTQSYPAPPPPPPPPPLSLQRSSENQHQYFWWVLLPIFFNIVGGAIGYFALRHKNRDVANILMEFGCLGFIITIAGSFFLGLYCLILQVVLLLSFAFVYRRSGQL